MTDFPLPAPPDNPSTRGANIQRTMTLLATSTPQRRHRVRILFYGQSINAQRWWCDVAADLRRRFPHADLTVANRSIGGFSAPRLVRVAEHDLYPYYPDLLIFHDYGGDDTGELERLIAETRRRTAAEIAIRTNHVTWMPRDASADDPRHKQREEQEEHHAAKLRQIASKYDCELIEVRQSWKRYLAAHRLHPRELLRDGIHLNDHGRFLMAALVKPSLRYDPTFSQSAWRELARDYPLDDSHVHRLPDGSVKLSFQGNRVDILPNHAAAAGSADVLIDGRRPSTFPRAYALTRPSKGPVIWWPAVTRIAYETTLLVETWRLEVRESDPAGRRFRFEVIGSKTGCDGQGSSDRRFVSNSGRVIIEPSDWQIASALELGKARMPADFCVTWKVRSLCRDVYRPPRTADPRREYAVRLIQGIANKSHSLRLVPRNNQPLMIRGIRVYRPPLQ